ncbi:MAG: hypothetical protein NC937_00090 [Candidatus Omnitrophica bacterium]|nr:hypothetical protein [Candidatus Omnitrophota bacterium]MCM8824539.1 hypothetical protein [Candidatus Omnitrophota bacterium]
MAYFPAISFTSKTVAEIKSPIQENEFIRISIPKEIFITLKLRLKGANPDIKLFANALRVEKFSGSNWQRISPTVVPIRKLRIIMSVYLINFIVIFYFY